MHTIVAWHTCLQAVLQSSVVLHGNHYPSRNQPDSGLLAIMHDLHLLDIPNQIVHVSSGPAHCL